jgi:8-oxo-dGTP pyrophosphatase MutT (NUDIX family)
VVTPREAATVMLVRDAPDLQVFMLRRNLNSDFVGGAYVFPGGAVDEADRAPELLDRCHGRDDASASRLLGLPSGGLGFWIAAIRESFEEAGVLLARSGGSGDLVDLEAGPVDVARRAVIAGERAFLEVVRGEDLLLDVGALHVFAHWITPAGAPRRYDTRFFVAEAPRGHTYLHDDGETVASEWVRPQDALDREARGELTLILPTLRSLAAIARFDRTSELIDTVRATQSEPQNPPRLVADYNGTRVWLPGDPSYDRAPEGVA